MRHLYPAPFPMERSFVDREVRSERARYKHLTSSLGGVAPPPPRELARGLDTQGTLNRACIWKHLLDEQQAVCHGAPKYACFLLIFCFCSLFKEEASLVQAWWFLEVSSPLVFSILLTNSIL